LAVRLIEVFLPADRLELARSSIGGKEVLSIWTEKLSEGQAELHILAEAQCSEEITDALRSALADSGDELRIVSLAVESSIPSPDKIEKEPGGTVIPHYSRKVHRISREELYSDVNEMTRTSWPNLMMTILSAIVAAVGFSLDSIAIIIGAMVIAPLLGPNVGLALGAAMGDMKMILHAARENALRISAALFFALIAGYFLHIDPSKIDSFQQLFERTEVHRIDLVVALSAGAAGAIAISTGASATIIGVMVAAALMPPLVAVGLLMGQGEWAQIMGPLHLLLINLISINLSGVLTFIAMGFRPWKREDDIAAKKSSLTAIIIWVLLLVGLGVLISIY